MFLKIIGGLVAVALSALVWYASPIMKPFPKPTGPYQVGLRTVEIATGNHNGSQEERTLVIHIFYPADESVSTRDKAPYLGNKLSAFQSMMAQYMGVPEWIALLLFPSIKTNAVADAPLCSLKKQYPVVLFSHGLLGLPSDMYVSILEEIASHGYFVLAIDHPYLNELTVYRDGRVISSADANKRFQKMVPEEQKEFQSRSIEAYKRDISSILDQLMAHNHYLGSAFLNHSDLERIAVMGHSAGGTAAIELCREDKRCKAAIDLDGWYDHIIGEKSIGKPLLLMFGSKSIELSEPTPDYLKRKNLTREQYFERERNSAEHRTMLCNDPHCRMIIIPGASHTDFSDEILLKWPLRAWDAADSYSTIRSINKGIVGFLDGTFQPVT